MHPIAPSHRDETVPLWEPSVSSPMPSSHFDFQEKGCLMSRTAIFFRFIYFRWQQVCLAGPIFFIKIVGLCEMSRH